ncbi:unnamed protein product [Pedinophyceae sp. YPF-701]|nr:unnamed protein product [Pedinophyceae sp. YPF-701]
MEGNLRSAERPLDRLAAPADRVAVLGIGLEDAETAAPSARGVEEGGGEQDPFRMTPLRFAGYTNEVGEAFKRFLPRSMYLGTYALASAYVAGDAVYQGSKAVEAGPSSPGPGLAVTDALIWQGLASVAIPGLAINRAVKLAQWMVERSQLGPRTKRFLPTVFGLSLVPLIVGPIDEGVERFMNYAVRPLLHRGAEIMPMQASASQYAAASPATISRR